MIPTKVFLFLYLQEWRCKSDNKVLNFHLYSILFSIFIYHYDFCPIIAMLFFFIVGLNDFQKKKNKGIKRRRSIANKVI